MHAAMLSSIAWRTPPIKTYEGCSYIYYRIIKTMADAVYRLGNALHHLYHPVEIIKVSYQWIPQPELSCKVSVYVPNVVFTCGVVHENDDKVKIYWCIADTTMCFGIAVIDDLIQLCLLGSRSPFLLNFKYNYRIFQSRIL